MNVLALWPTFPLLPTTPEAWGQLHGEMLDWSEIFLSIFQFAGLPTCLSGLLPVCQAVWLHLLCHHVSSTLATMNIGLIVIPLACLPPFSSLPPIPMLAAPFACVTAQAFIYRPNVIIGAKRWGCREGEWGGEMICYQCHVRPQSSSSVKVRLAVRVLHLPCLKEDRVGEWIQGEAKQDEDWRLVSSEL